MEVFLEETQETRQLDADTVQELLKKLNINPTTVIVSRNGSLLIESQKLEKEDKIEILPVVSGG